MTSAESPASSLRPSVPPPRPVPWDQALATALLLVLLVLWTLHPVWPDTFDHIVGDPDTDAIRGMWGLDHLRRSLLPPDTPLWSWQVNFPHGVLALVLPYTTGVMLAPLGAVFGPVAGYNLAIGAMLWAGAFATAWLVRSASGSWAAGAAVGGAMISQPILLHSVADGTPEHVAIWGIPAFLAAAVKALRSKAPLWGLVAGVLAFAVAMDSPYHAIYAAVIAVIVLPLVLVGHWESGRRAELGLTLGALIGAAAFGALVMGLLFRNFPIEEKVGLDPDALLNMNAADLHTWWQFDFAPVQERDPSLAPTLIPTYWLWGCLALGLLGAPRSLPWMLAGALMVMLSFGLNKLLPAELAQWLGAPGGWTGAMILRANDALYDLPGLSSLRFPRRWLVPAAMTFAVGAGFGLRRLFTLLRRFRVDRFGVPVVAVALAVAGTQAGIQSSRVHTMFPMQALPPVQFADWIADQPGDGAVVLIPQSRPAPRTGKRGDLPVFASIAPSLSSADEQYLQVRYGRPSVSYPTLKTLVPMRFDADVYRLMRNWDDLAHPMLSGNPIPRSAYDEHSEGGRQATIQRLREAGLRFVVIDRAAFDDEAIGILDRQLQPHVAGVHDFEDGTGVRVYELRQE